MFLGLFLDIQNRPIYHISCKNDLIVMYIVLNVPLIFNIINILPNIMFAHIFMTKKSIIFLNVSLQ